MKSIYVLFVFPIIFVSQAFAAEQVTTISYSSLKKSFEQTKVLVFDDGSEKLYGDITQNKMHLGLLCKVLKNIPYGAEPKSIFIDISLVGDRKAADCILEVVGGRDIPLVLSEDKNHLFSPDLSPLWNSVAHGYAQILTLSDQKSKREDSVWLRPETRVSLVKPAVIPFFLPAYFLTLVEGMTDAEIRNLNYAWSREIYLEHFSEQDQFKTSYQDILSGNKLESLKNKYVFVGVDQDKYDSFSNLEGEVVNGVFVHQHFLAAYLSASEAALRDEKVHNTRKVLVKKETIEK